MIGFLAPKGDLQSVQIAKVHIGIKNGLDQPKKLNSLGMGGVPANLAGGRAPPRRRTIMAVGLNRDDLLELFKERRETFKQQFTKCVDGWELPLKFQTETRPGGSLNLMKIPEFRKWVGDVAIQASIFGVEAFINTLTMDSPELSESESLRKDNAALRQSLKDAYRYIVQLGGTIHPTDWPEYDLDDTLPWSSSPH